MADTNKEINTPGGRPVAQENPPSLEAGLMDSGGDQLLLYYNHYNQSQDMLRNNNTLMSESENITLYPFQKSKKLSRSPTRVSSPSFGENSTFKKLDVNFEAHPKNALLQENRNLSATEEKLYNELCKANNALAETNRINKQLNDTIAWMQEHIKKLEGEVLALNAKGNIRSIPNQKTKEPEHQVQASNGKENVCPTTNQETNVMEYHTDEEELARETGWIRVKNKKRKRNNTPTPPQIKETTPKIIQKSPKKVPPPPPIVIDGVQSYDLLYEKIKTITTTDKFTTKLTNNGKNIKVNLVDGDTYRKISHMLSAERHSWHTFENKQTRPIRVMAKNLHNTCKPEKIIDDLKAKGFKATDASIKLKRRSKEPLNMFMLTFSAEEDIEKIYQINNILGCKVNIQPLRRSKLIPQCRHCQAYGHTQKYCNKEPRCVKCTGKHHTSDCAKPSNVQPKCVHCGENHPANYRGCSIAVELQNIRNKNMGAKNAKNTNISRKQIVKMNKSEIINEELKQKVPATPQREMGKKTYSQVMTNNENKSKTAQNSARGINQTLQLILNKLNTFDERLKKLEYSTKGAIPKQQNDQRT